MGCDSDSQAFRSLRVIRFLSIGSGRSRWEDVTRAVIN
jgi:hypothetical protein